MFNMEDSKLISNPPFPPFSKGGIITALLLEERNKRGSFFNGSIRKPPFEGAVPGVMHFAKGRNAEWYTLLLNGISFMSPFVKGGLRGIF
jgi:hypothetical protein